MTEHFLAASTGTPLYIDPIKIAVSAVLFFAWAWAVQWIDRDTDVVKTKRERWNLIVLSGSFVAFLVFFIPPWSGGLFSLGVAFWLLIVGGVPLVLLHAPRIKAFPGPLARREIHLEHRQGARGLIAQDAHTQFDTLNEFLDEDRE